MTRSDDTPPAGQWERQPFSHDPGDVPACGHRRGLALYDAMSDDGFNVCPICDDVDRWPPAT